MLTIEPMDEEDASNRTPVSYTHLFVATLLFKDKFTEEERNSGLTYIVTGLLFLTEGAIPFGACLLYTSGKLSLIGTRRSNEDEPF